MHVRLDRLLFPDPVAAGMDIYTLMALTKFYRTTNEHSEPIVVRRVGKRFWRICDGRHRVTSSMMAGRKTVLAIEEQCDGLKTASAPSKDA